jgi:hypothetical protein
MVMGSRGVVLRWVAVVWLCALVPSAGCGDDDGHPGGGGDDAGPTDAGTGLDALTPPHDDGGGDLDAGGLDAGDLDAMPSCPDADGDTVCDADDVCPGFDDLTDDDSDQVPDGCDVCPGGDDSVDPDTDGVPSFCDNCPAVANGDQANSDVDTRGDVCDNCPGVTNESQVDGDAGTAGCTPATPGPRAYDGGDGGDACDNCPTVCNQSQANSHGIAAVPVPFTPPLSCDDDGGPPGIECTTVGFTNGLSSPIPLSSSGTFNFTFFGRVYTHVIVSENGLVYLGASANPADFAGSSPGAGGGGVIPLYDNADTLVAGVWTDIENPVVTIDELGTGANNSFIVNISGTGYSSQIAFFESSNRIEIRTIQLGAGGTVDTRGVEAVFDGAQCIPNGLCNVIGGENCFTCAADCCGTPVSPDGSFGVAFGHVGALFLSESPPGSDDSASPLSLVSSQVVYTTSAVPDAVGDACDNLSVVPACGDGICNGVCNPRVFGECETAVNCPGGNGGDCSCGDGVCDDSEHAGDVCSDSPGFCAADCAPCCGDNVCDPSSGEDPFSCPADCFCGDSVCSDSEHDGDDCSSDINLDFCPFDCAPCCGDQLCTAPETCGTCAIDCLNDVCDGDEGSACNDLCECTENAGGPCGVCFCPG